jgi:enoyl-CoA hydratase/carnithine racemase
MDDFVHLRQDGETLHIEMARPAKRNALTAAMYAAMADGLSRAENDPVVRSVIFSGQGQEFCAGNDLNDFIASPPAADAPVFRFIHGLAAATKVLIAAVQGRAVGIGTTMLLHCDFVLAEPDAAFMLPFVDLALVPEAGSSLLLPGLLGQRRAADLLLLGETLPAAEAVTVGLVNRIVPAGEALPAARSLAARLSTKPAGALQATKMLMKSAIDDLPGRIDEEIRVFGDRLRSAELKARVEAFFTRKPG